MFEFPIFFITLNQSIRIILRLQCAEYSKAERLLKDLVNAVKTFHEGWQDKVNYSGSKIGEYND
ncbi:hypothetical protein B9T33_06455 [Acinetobacter sp. ANC 5054]|nr:hypothetical protein B9T33_06455 [Acinetobacter sp. ANC 5054]